MYGKEHYYEPAFYKNDLEGSVHTINSNFPEQTIKITESGAENKEVVKNVIIQNFRY